MKRTLVVVAVGAAVLATQVGVAGATNECRGLNQCVPVVGPWLAHAARDLIEWGLR